MQEKLWSRDFIIACLANFFIASSFYLLMPTIPIYLSEQLNVPHSQIGIVLSSYVIALLLIRPFSGYIVDVYPRKLLYLFGAGMFVLIYIGYYFAATIIFFFILRFIHGLFWGLTAVSANTVAIDIIPSSRRAEGIGFFGVTLNLAMAIAPFIAVKIYDNYSFNALISFALIMGTIAIISISLIHVPKRECVGKKPPISLDRFILVKGIPIFFNQLFLAFGYGTLVAYAVLYGKHIGIDNPGIFFLFIALGTILTRIFSGRLVDKGHLHKVMLFAIVAIGIGFYSFATFQEIYSFCISAFILGVGYGTLFPALQMMYVNMAPASQRGTANSTYLTGFDLGIGAGMLIGAYLEDHYGFEKMYLITAALCFIALLIYWFNSRKVYERNRL
ncbi:MAG: MFS transporter [Crocinitomicaceae bacterium]|nr:MFS transporter [Crocinitomicaceae bacterium]